MGEKDDMIEEIEMKGRWGCSGSSYTFDKALALSLARQLGGASFDSSRCVYLTWERML